MVVKEILRSPSKKMMATFRKRNSKIKLQGLNRSPSRGILHFCFPEFCGHAILEKPCNGLIFLKSKNHYFAENILIGEGANTHN